MTPFQQQFRHAMAACAAAVFVVTTAGRHGRLGITMTAVTSVTDEPPTLILCINRKARIHAVLHEHERLCVNVLNSDQREVAEHFAGITRLTDAERFSQHLWHENARFAQPELDGALACLHGHIVERHTVGSHSVFYVRLDECRLNPDAHSALVYYRRSFMPLSPAADTPDTAAS